LPRNEHSIALTDHYRRQLLALRQATTLRVAPAWAAVDLADFEASFARLAPVIAAVIAGGQGTMVGLTGAYALAYLRHELDDPTVPPPEADTRARVGQTVDGRPVQEALRPVAVTVTQGLMLGWQPGRAQRAGWNKLARAVAWQTLSAAHLALGDTIRVSDHVGGWRRVCSANSCGACLGMADGHVMSDQTPMRRHSHCRCVAAPVVRGVTEHAHYRTGQQLFDALTEPEQAQLFAGRGGEEKAQVARDQGVAALVAPDRTDTAGTLITERPLEAVT
jgi:hypothetical protein